MKEHNQHDTPDWRKVIDFISGEQPGVWKNEEWPDLFRGLLEMTVDDLMKSIRSNAPRGVMVRPSPGDPAVDGQSPDSSPTVRGVLHMPSSPVAIARLHSLKESGKILASKKFSDSIGLPADFGKALYFLCLKRAEELGIPEFSTLGEKDRKRGYLFVSEQSWIPAELKPGN